MIKPNFAELPLGDRIVKAKDIIPIAEVLLLGDVKEFIRLLKDNLHDLHDCENDFGTDEYRHILRVIDKLAGEKLK